MVHLVVAKFSTHFGTICALLGKFSLLKMAKYWKYNMVIWSHCTRSDFCTFAYFCNFFTSFGTEKNVPLPSGGNPVHRIEQRLFRKLPTLIRVHLNTILGLFYLVLSWYILEFTLNTYPHQRASKYHSRPLLFSFVLVHSWIYIMPTVSQPEIMGLFHLWANIIDLFATSCSMTGGIKTERMKLSD